MKFSILQETLWECLQKAVGVVPSRSSTPILENLLFELDKSSLRITGTDLEVWVTAETEPDTIESQGAVTLPARVITEMIRALPNIPIHFEMDETHKVKISTERGLYQISGISKENFPELPSLSSGKKFEVDNGKLSRMFTKTIFAVSPDELRPALMGIFVQIFPQEFRMVATDGHRLSKIVDTGFKTEASPVEMIIPPKAVQLALKNLGSEGKTQMTVEEKKMVCFQFNRTRLYTRLVEGQYPDYERVIPKDNTIQMVVNKTELMATVKRVALFSNAFTHQVRFVLQPNLLTVCSEDLEVGGEAKEELVAQYQAEPMEIGYNAYYILDILKQIDTEDAIFYLKNATSAALIAPAEQLPNESFEMLLMPIKLSQ